MSLFKLRPFVSSLSTLNKGPRRGMSRTHTLSIASYRRYGLMPTRAYCTSTNENSDPSNNPNKRPRPVRKKILEEEVSPNLVPTPKKIGYFQTRINRVKAYVYERLETIKQKILDIRKKKKKEQTKEELEREALLKFYYLQKEDFENEVAWLKYQNSLSQKLPIHHIAKDLSYEYDERYRKKKKDTKWEEFKKKYFKGFNVYQSLTSYDFSPTTYIVMLFGGGALFALLMFFKPFKSKRKIRTDHQVVSFIAQTVYRTFLDSPSGYFIYDEDSENYTPHYNLRLSDPGDRFIAPILFRIKVYYVHLRQALKRGDPIPPLSNILKIYTGNPNFAFTVRIPFKNGKHFSVTYSLFYNVDEGYYQLGDGVYGEYSPKERFFMQAINRFGVLRDIVKKAGTNIEFPHALEPAPGPYMTTYKIKTFREDRDRIESGEREDLPDYLFAFSDYDEYDE